MKKYFFFLTLIIPLLLVFTQPNQVFAAKARVAAKKTTAVTATRPTVSVKFRSDRKAIILTVYSMQTANSGAYELTYNGNGIDQGVVGAFLPSEGSTISRTLLFGTCSKAVCTYHQNINNTQLKLTFKLKNGQTLIKRYKIKV